MKLTYWVAECLTDSTAYSVRERTRKAVVARLNQKGPQALAGTYGKPHKVTIEYASAFDLLVQCLSEGGVGESIGEESTYHKYEDHHDAEEN